MSKPESVQYFQFDEAGNMYVFAPGAGCSGDAKLVKPGDEMIFSSSWETEKKGSDGQGSHGDSVELEGALTCPSAGRPSSSGHTFKAPLADEDLANLSHKNFSEETMRKVHWVRKMYSEWRSYRHSLGLEYIECDLENKETISEESLKFGLCRFITEVKKVNGEEFPGKTLYDIIVCMQFHLECMGYSYKIINDVAFKDLKFTLDNTMKECTARGIGISIKQAEILSSTDEDLLWSSGYLGSNYPDQLMNTVVFCVSKGFALHAGKEHRAL